MRFAALGFLLATVCFAAPASVRVVDGSGAPARNVLVIVKAFGPAYFNDVRQLTDEQGRIRPLELQPGTYQVIAASPYGIWGTSVEEFLVLDKPVALTLTVSQQPTHGFGDVVTPGASQTALQILTSDGVPASGANILARDKDATLHLQRWYTADKAGKARIEVVAKPTIIVVIYGGKLFSAKVAPDSTSATIRLPKR